MDIDVLYKFTKSRAQIFRGTNNIPIANVNYDCTIEKFS